MRYLSKVVLLVGLVFFWQESSVAAPVPVESPEEAGLTSLTLKGAEQLWRVHSRELRLAQGAVVGYEADQVSAAAKPNPQLSLFSGSLASRNIRGAALPDWRVETTVGVSQLIERGDKRQLRMQFAGATTDAARREFSSASISQMMILYQAYYAVLLAQTQLAIARDSSALAHQILDVAQTRLKAGDIPPSDVTRIRVDWLRAEGDVNQSEAALADARLSLAYLIGMEARAELIHVADSWPEDVNIDGTRVDINARPDVRAALARVRAAEAARDLAKSLRTRDVNVSVLFDRNLSPGNANAPANTLGVTLSVPLFTNYQYDGELARAEADLQLARDVLEARRAQARTAISKAQAALESARLRAKRYSSELMGEAARSSKAAEFAFSHGAMGAMDLLDARRVFKSVQMDAAVARTDFANAWVAWRAATAIGDASNE